MLLPEVFVALVHVPAVVILQLHQRSWLHLRLFEPLLLKGMLPNVGL